MSKTHHKELSDSNFLASWQFKDGEDMILTISKIEKEEVYNPQSHSNESVPVAHFEGDVKPLILNATNRERMELVLGSPYIEDWIGKKIALHTENVKYKGQMTQGIRVNPNINPNKAQAKAKPKVDLIMLTKKSENWAGVVSYVESNRNMDFSEIVTKLKTKYKMSKTTEGELELIHGGDE
jgi:hypothetical protein